MSEWQETTLAATSERIDYGYTASAKNDPLLPRLLRITDIVGSHIDWSGVPGCSIEDAKLPKYRVKPGDILVARTGATVGHAKRIRQHPEAVFASYLVRFRPSKEVDPAYLGAVVESAEYKAFVKQNAGGAAQPNANAKVLGSFPFLLPDLPTQQRIGAVFDALNDLIENNRRRVVVLEEMARALYREWFVHFRYPGHEDHPMIDSRLGSIPEGWQVVRLEDQFEVVVGSTPSRRRPDYWADGLVPWVNSSEINSLRILSGTSLITEDAVRSTSTKLMPSGTALLAVTGATLGQVSRLEVAACGSQNVCGVFDPAGLFDEYIYLVLCDEIGDIANHATGGAQQHINRGIVAGWEVRVPSGELADVFGLTIRPMFEMQAAMLREIETLVATRDSLLPRLVSGRIAVSGLDLDALVAAGAA